MSITSFLSKIWATIKKLFDGLEQKLKVAVGIGVLIVENIKTWTESPELDILTAIIPGDLDDHIKDCLREELPKIFKKMKLADEGLTDNIQTVSTAVKQLQNMEGDFKHAFLHNLSVLIAQVAADGKLTWQDGVYILQWYYQHRFKQE